MSLTTINHGNQIDISRFSEKENIAQLQAETIKHALSVSAQLQTEISPDYQATKRAHINATLTSEQTRQTHNTIGIMTLAVCFIFFVGFVAKQPITVPAPRTINDGDLESTNKILQRDLMLVKRDLDLKTREVEMLEREFKSLREKSGVAGVEE